MKKILFYTCASIFATPAIACVPYPGDVYDDLTAANVYIAFASVVSYRTYDGDNGNYCTETGYETTSLIKGRLPPMFQISVCDEHVSFEEGSEYWDDMDDGGMRDTLGLFVGAKIIVAVVEQGTDSYALAEPTCWGPIHFNIAEWEQDELDSFVNSIR